MTNKDVLNELFKEHLQNCSLSGLNSICKSDLHNHFGRGGSREYLESIFNIKIDSPPEKFEAFSHMDEWFIENIKKYCPYLKRLEAAFVQAASDNISVLAASFGFDEENMMAFIQTMKSLNLQFAPNTILLPEYALDRACDTDRELSRLDEVLSYKWFKSIDISYNEFAQPIKKFKKIYRKAKEYGLILRAHVGEFGTADDVMEAVEELELDEVHHGIAAAKSEQVMKWLSDHKIQLNVCPTSNIILRVVESYSVHPIRQLFDYGIPVTINTDDMLVFNQSVSQEYLNIFKSGLMNAEELDIIREIGLRALEHYN
ncbi:MAG: adenosine deaminase [Clostridiales bacterium]|jgi:adenosine deaminase|nr:adenosine deaminase [Clostridiales bacterium]